MIISESSLAFFSHHSTVSEHRRTESLNYWTTQPDRQEQFGGDLAQTNTTNMTTASSSVKVSLSQKSIEQTSDSAELGSDEEREVMADLNMRILRALIERLTGKKVRVNSIPTESEKIRESEIQSSSENTLSNEGINRPGFGLEYDLHEKYYEAEETTFTATGFIHTSDGNSVDFDLRLHMKREYYEQENISIRMGEALKDPLVINFSGTSADLLDSKHLFDIDADGEMDTISYLSPESGFLALDRNGDGIVNDGSELFGALTGHGFEELAQYDNDGNGWIDENDAVFVDLRIWLKDAESEELVMLDKKGIGAIYLENISTPFELKSGENDKLGQVRSSGIYLAEDHSVGSVQQIDLVV